MNELIIKSNVRNHYGITEHFWNNLSEDKKFLWKVISWTTAFLASILISKTGIRVFDWLVVGFSTFTALLIIENQRNLRRYKNPTVRKRILRTTIILGSSGVTLLGMAFFIGLSYTVAKIIFENYGIQAFNQTPLSGALGFIMIFTVLAGIFHGLFKSFRDLQLEELFYKLPLSQLRKLLILRPYVANNFAEFAFFEASVIVTAFIYCSTVANIAQVFIDLSRL